MVHRSYKPSFEDPTAVPIRTAAPYYTDTASVMKDEGRGATDKTVKIAENRRPGCALYKLLHVVHVPPFLPQQLIDSIRFLAYNLLCSMYKHTYNLSTGSVLGVAIGIIVYTFCCFEVL